MRGSAAAAAAATTTTTNAARARLLLLLPALLLRATYHYSTSGYALLLLQTTHLAAPLPLSQVRGKWKSTPPNAAHAKLYCELHTGGGGQPKLVFFRPSPGGGIEPNPAGSFQTSTFVGIERVVDKTAALGAKWRVRLALASAHREPSGAAAEDSLVLCFDAVADMQMWSEALEWSTPPAASLSDTIVVVAEDGEFRVSEAAFNDRSVVSGARQSKASGGLSEYDTQLVEAYSKLSADESRLMGELTSENERVVALREAKEALVKGMAPSFRNLDLSGLTQITRNETDVYARKPGKKGGKATLAGDEPQKWSSQEHTFYTEAPLRLEVKGVRSNATTWVVVTGFRRPKDGTLGIAEASGFFKLGDVLTAVNGEPVLSLSFDAVAETLAEAAFPLTIATVRDPAAKLPDVEGWASRVTFNPACGPPSRGGGGGTGGTGGATSRQRFCAVRDGRLYYHKPTPGGGLQATPEGYVTVSLLLLLLLLLLLVRPHTTALAATAPDGTTTPRPLLVLLLSLPATITTH